MGCCRIGGVEGIIPLFQDIDSNSPRSGSISMGRCCIGRLSAVNLYIDAYSFHAIYPIYPNLSQSCPPFLPARPTHLLALLTCSPFSPARPSHLLALLTCSLALETDRHRRYGRREGGVCVGRVAVHRISNFLNRGFGCSSFIANLKG